MPCRAQPSPHSGLEDVCNACRMSLASVLLTAFSLGVWPLGLGWQLTPMEIALEEAFQLLSRVWLTFESRNA